MVAGYPAVSMPLLARTGRRAWSDVKGLLMIGHGVGNSFEFVVLASLRVRQLVDGCTPRVEGGGKKTTIAKREVLAGKVESLKRVIPVA